MCGSRLEERGFRQEKEKKNSQGEDPRNNQENSPETLKKERWRKRKKKKEKRRRRHTEKKEMVEKVQRDHHKSVFDGDEGGRVGKGRKEKSKTRQSEANLGEIWEVALSPFFATGAELAKCQCCSSRTTKKNGSGDENAT